MKGVSPIVGAVLLIAITVIAGVGTWYWVSSYTGKPIAIPYSAVLSAENCDLTYVILRNTGSSILDHNNVPFYDSNNVQVGYVNIVGFSGGTATPYPLRITYQNVTPGLFYIAGADIPRTKVSCNTRANKSAVYFDGTGSYVNVSDSASINLTNQFTLMAWVKTNTINGSWRRVISKRELDQPGNGYGFGLYDQGLVFTTYNILDYITVGNYITATNRWYHIAVVFDSGNDANFYVDGVFKETVLGTVPAGTTDDNLFIGIYRQNGGVTGQFFDGTIDDVMIYNRTLSAAEINNTYLGNPPIDGNLSGYWKFDWDPLDYSGKINNGTLYAGVAWTRDHTMG